MSAPKRIGIAIVESAGRYLVGVRGPDVPLPGYAEFPGGKCLPDESAIDCALRECYEETGLSVVAEKLMHRVEFEYPHGRVDLHFVLCRPTNQFDVSEQHSGFSWKTFEELAEMKFPEANASVLEMLRK